MWAYVRGSIKEPITATHSELVALDQTLLFYVTLTLTRQVSGVWISHGSLG